eukprot:TRINITY_DN553_c0_g1_i1.p1 TRINITY_DN553_c0_g1~~TRINITY_DN553_c0_g1_i1.p1  ORF type:complete len:330 (+),score=43.74 TRINITY_DN553_c0_g1_i1:103-1092(+)
MPFTSVGLQMAPHPSQHTNNDLGNLTENLPVEFLQSFGALDNGNVFTASMMADGLSPCNSRRQSLALDPNQPLALNSSHMSSSASGSSSFSDELLSDFVPETVSYEGEFDYRSLPQGPGLNFPSTPVAASSMTPASSEPTTPTFIPPSPSLLQQATAIMMQSRQQTAAANQQRINQLYQQQQVAFQQRQNLEGRLNQVAPNSNASHSIIKQNDSTKYVDITSLLTFSQKEAARKLGIPKSTLSKRWREATLKRKWPQKVIAKIDKDIEQILMSVPPSFCLRTGNNSSGKIEDDATARPASSVDAEQLGKNLDKLFQRRLEELRPVTIRL